MSTERADEHALVAARGMRGIRSTCGRHRGGSVLRALIALLKDRAMSAATGLVCRVSITFGSAIDQFGRPADAPGMLGRSASRKASSRVAHSRTEGASASSRCVADTACAGDASGAKPASRATRSRLAFSVSSNASMPSALIAR